MKYDKKEGAWVFSSGTTRYADTEHLSIGTWNDAPIISYGSDGDFWMLDYERKDMQEPALTQADLVELADDQIERWQKFKQWLAERQIGDKQ